MPMADQSQSGFARLSPPQLPSAFSSDGGDLRLANCLRQYASARFNITPPAQEQVRVPKVLLLVWLQLAKRNLCLLRTWQLSSPLVQIVAVGFFSLDVAYSCEYIHPVHALLAFAHGPFLHFLFIYSFRFFSRLAHSPLEILNKNANAESCLMCTLRAWLGVYFKLKFSNLNCCRNKAPLREFCRIPRGDLPYTETFWETTLVLLGNTTATSFSRYPT